MSGLTQEVKRPAAPSLQYRVQMRLAYTWLYSEMEYAL